MDKHAADFSRQCYDLLKKIPAGRVTTYREMARAMNTRAWRAIGNAMAKNPDLIVVPCHRVVRANGDIGGYALGPDRKAELLSVEGVRVANHKVVNMEDVMFRFQDKAIVTPS